MKLVRQQSHQPYFLSSQPVRCRVDPFAKDSPLKAMPVLAFPPDFFFVLRVIQLLR